MAIQGIEQKTMREFVSSLSRNKTKVNKFKKDFEKIERRVKNLPEAVYKGIDLEVLLANKQLCAILNHLFIIEEEYSNILEKELTDHVQIKNACLFTIYWNDGRRKVLGGDTIEHAFTKAGYTTEDTATIAWYDQGVTNSHTWNIKKREWEPMK